MDKNQMLVEEETGCLFCRKAKNATVPPPHLQSRSLSSGTLKRLTSKKTQTEASAYRDEPPVIPLKKVKPTGVEIGRGAYGRVFEVECRGKTRYAAKEVHAILLQSAEDKGLQTIEANFLRECQIWSQLHHPCIVQCIGIYYPAKNTLPVILMEKMQFGLANVVEKHGDLTLNKTTIILNDVCLGLQYLHTRIPPIVHRDLTPNNILLCHHLRAKISDLGMARILQTTDTKTLTQAPGTPAFMPPECLADKPVYDLAIDIFSFGGVILYIATQQWPHPAPWISFDPYTGKKSILSSELQRRQQYLDKMARTYESLKPLAISCLDDNPKKRPTVKEVSIEIKKISNVKCQVSMYCDIWAGDDPTQTQKQQERLQDRQQKQGHQHKQDQQEKIEQQNQQDEQQSIRLENQQQSLQCILTVDGKQPKETSKTKSSVNLLSTATNISPTESEDMSSYTNTDGASQIASSCDDGKPVPSEPKLDEAKYLLYVAKYDCSTTEDTCLNFKKGDLFYVLSTDEEGWWFAKAKNSGQEGYIPNNFVAKVNTLDAEDWFFGAITRKHAENLLMQPFNGYGSFLIRNSESTPGDYSLSIKLAKRVIHYKIKHSSKGYCISTEAATFESVSKLVSHYSKAVAGDLCTNLKNACLITKPRSASSSEEATETWEVGRTSIRFVRKLGTGRFGDVWQGLWNGTTEVAVKELKPGMISAHEFSQEAALMKQLKHLKLIQLYAVCTQEEPIYIITELMKHGSLLEYLRGDGRSLKLPQLIDMGAQVAAGMAYLEEKNYVHRDLAARNILVSESLICKVEVISMVRILSEEIYKVCTGMKFSIKWTAPEALFRHHFTIKSDVWSFGILLYELITYGSFPYPGMNNTEVVEKLKTGYRMPCLMGCPQQLYKIMGECWRNEAASRPTFESLHWRMEDFYIANEPSHLYLHQVR